jgi:transcriptional regulator with GAF, ATPase, and Fis domain
MNVDLDRELERLRRLDAIDELLPTLAEVLDVREVFARIGEIAKRVIPHDALGLVVASEDGGALIPHAITGTGLVVVGQRIELPAKVREHLQTIGSFEIVDDIQTRELEKDLPPVRQGLRASLRLPIRYRGELIAGVNFMSFTPALYTHADALIARRIADHIALALSHQRLAEEAARAAEARERAGRLEARVRSLSEELAAIGGFHRVIGESPTWKKVLTQATQVAATDTTVLLQGESGTGKEVVARFIHRGSARQQGPFIAINCAALPEQLLESELFGYERGAFTGATQSKPGQIELAAGGTLFLDEVAEMSPSAQAKFLRVLQEREFQRLGSTRKLRADVRVIAATNRDLAHAIERGAFREDLFYRLHVFGIRLPPLRERPADILPLSDAFLHDLGRSFGRPPAGISREARDALLAYVWPGNVRELRNVLERAAILCQGGLILAEHLGLRDQPSESPRAIVASPPPLTPDAAPNATPNGASDAVPAAGAAAGIARLAGRARLAGPAGPAGPAGAGAVAPPPEVAAAPTGSIESMERAMIERALQDARFNKSKAARLLGLTRTQLYVRLRRYGLE